MRLAAAALLAVVAAGCGGDDELDGDGDAGADASAVDAAPADGGVRRLARASYPLMLAAGAFAPVGGHPNALVVVPEGFAPTPPVAVVVYIHGFQNCIENVVRDVGQACRPGGPARSASNLIAQLEASGKNALLVLPEVAFDVRDGSAGKLGTDGGLRALLAEAFAAVAVLDVSVTDIGKLIVVSHSGGYQVAAALALRGGLRVDEVWLLDSLYDLAADFESWARSDTAGLVGSPPRRRFADVYTMNGGTFGDSQTLATRARTWVPGMPEVLVDDRTTATWPDDRYRHGLLFKLSGLSHDGVTRYYFEQLLANSDVPAR